MSRPETRRRQVAVGPFHVSDASSSVLVRDVVALTSAEQRPTLVYALHVGGLNSRRDRDFVAAMDRADVVYADGGSVVWLARLAGATSIERAPTTDVGWDILRGLAEALGRPVRVALVGGPAGLAERAAAVLQQHGPVQVVHTDHGYHSDWTAPLAALRDSAPDACLVGLGAPAEMVWCDRHRDELPTGLVLTCGGWFGHLVGDERRAPRLLRRSGLEWIARLAQAPGRLGPRYARGLVSTAALAVRVRLRGRPRSRAV